MEQKFHAVFLCLQHPPERGAADAEALRRTDDTILSIAGQTGFENLSHFNRQFKRRYGMTPREYRALT